jgi:hypothetical protein
LISDLVAVAGGARKGRVMSLHKLLAFARYRSIPHDFLAKARELDAKRRDSPTKSPESFTLSHDICSAFVI